MRFITFHFFNTAVFLVFENLLIIIIIIFIIIIMLLFCPGPCGLTVLELTPDQLVVSFTGLWRTLAENYLLKITLENDKYTVCRHHDTVVTS